MGKLLKKASIYLTLFVGGIFVAFPFYWMLITAFKDGKEALQFPPTLFPSNLHPENFINVWKTIPLPTYFANTLIITVVSVLGVVITSLLAAYVFARLEFKGREVIFVSLIALMQIPLPLYLIPSYMLLSKIGWIDTYLALTVPWTVNIFSIFLLRQFFKTIPEEIFESARIDGANEFTILRRIALPLAKTPLTAIIIFNIIGGWNSFLWPLIMTDSDFMRPIQVGLAYYSRAETTNYPLLMAASLMAILPLLILYLIAQRYIIRSLSFTGSKY